MSGFNFQSTSSPSSQFSFNSTSSSLPSTGFAPSNTSFSSSASISPFPSFGTPSSSSAPTFSSTIFGAASSATGTPPSFASPFGASSAAAVTTPSFSSSTFGGSGFGAPSAAQTTPSFASLFGASSAAAVTTPPFSSSTFGGSGFGASSAAQTSFSFSSSPFAPSSGASSVSSLSSSSIFAPSVFTTFSSTPSPTTSLSLPPLFALSSSTPSPTTSLPFPPLFALSSAVSSAASTTPATTSLFMSSTGSLFSASFNISSLSTPSLGFSTSSSGAFTSNASSTSSLEKPATLGAFSATSLSSTTSSSTPAGPAAPSSTPILTSSQVTTSASTPIISPFGVTAGTTTGVTSSAAAASTSSAGTTLSLSTKGSAPITSLSTAPLFGVPATTSAETSARPIFSSSGATTTQPISSIIAASSIGTSSSTISTTQSAVPKLPSEIPGKTVVPKLPSEITGKTVEEIIKDWNSELQERTGKFRKQATAIAEWDQRILQNRDILLTLESEFAEVVETQTSLERQLELIEIHQQEVDKALQSFEEEAERIYKNEKGLLFEDEAASTRDSMYEQAEFVEREMEQMADQIKSIIQTLNASQRGDLDVDDKMSSVDAVMKILDNQLSSLMWIDEKKNPEAKGYTDMVLENWEDTVTLFDKDRVTGEGDEPFDDIPEDEGEEQLSDPEGEAIDGFISEPTKRWLCDAAPSSSTQTAPKRGGKIDHLASAIGEVACSLKEYLMTVKQNCKPSSSAIYELLLTVPGLTRQQVVNAHRRLRLEGDPSLIEMLQSFRSEEKLFWIEDLLNQPPL